MKAVINKVILLVLVSVSLFACEDDNVEVTKELDGRWEIQSVSILENGQWTFLDDQDDDLGFLYFEACEDRNQNCNGYREASSGEKAEFEFSVSGADKDYNSTTVNMAFYPTSDPAMEWQGVYDIVALSTVLTLERTNDDLIIKAKRP